MFDISDIFWLRLQAHGDNRADRQKLHSLMASGYTMNTRPGPSAATLLISLFAIFAMKPSTEKITKPDSMLVRQLIVLVRIASLQKKLN